jgi:hypothetical protein
VYEHSDDGEDDQRPPDHRHTGSGVSRLAGETLKRPKCRLLRREGSIGDRLGLPAWAAIQRLLPAN